MQRNDEIAVVDKTIVFDEKVGDCALEVKYNLQQPPLQTRNRD